MHNELQEFLENKDEFDEEENDLNQKEDDFDQNVERLKEYNKWLPVSDLLHLLKSMKRKLLGIVIKIAIESPDIDFNIEKEILKESPYYQKNIESTSSLDTMKDNLALMIFNKDNNY